LQLNIGVVSDYDGDRTAEAIVADLKKDPNAVKVIKSEPTPVQGDDEAVKVVVGNTFNEIVLDLDKNVLLKVYAPWCGHCKKLAPVWEKLGESSVLSPDIVIAKMDLTLNDMPKLDIKVKGFPTILLFKAKTNEIVEYHGDRSLEGKNSFFVDLKKFVEKHTSAGNLGKQNSGHEEL
jgi:protein disulfide-isomerase A1